MSSYIDPMHSSLADLIEQGEDVPLPVPDTAEPMVIRSVRLKVSTMAQLEDFAAQRGVGVTVLMRELIEAGLNNEDEQQAYVTLSEAINLLTKAAHQRPSQGAA